MPNLSDHQVELYSDKSEIIVQTSLYWFHLPTVLIDIKPSFLLHNSTLLTMKIDCKGILYTLTCNEVISLLHFCVSKLFNHKFNLLNFFYIFLLSLLYFWVRCSFIKILRNININHEKMLILNFKLLSYTNLQTDIRIGLSTVDEEVLWSSNIQILNNMDPQSQQNPDYFHQCSIHSSSLCYQFIISCHQQQGIYIVDIKERFVIHNFTMNSLVSVLCMTESFAEEKVGC